MRVIGLLLIAGALVLGAGAQSAWATTYAQVQIDEYGVGTIDNVPLVSGTGVDHFGFTGLYYTLPFLVTPGDVVLLEQQPVPPGLVLADVSDIVRFEQVGNETRLFFFSEADVLPDNFPQVFASLQPGYVQVPEIGTECYNWALYTATDYTMPGGSTFGEVQYQIISDVPEPVTMAGLMLGIGGIAGYVRKRRKA